MRLSYERTNIKEFADELGVDVQRIYKWRKGIATKALPESVTAPLLTLGVLNKSSD